MIKKFVYRLFVFVTLLALLVGLGGETRVSASPAQAVPVKSVNFIFRKTISGLTQPIFITNAGDSRLFIVERAGLILIYKNGALLPTPFLDIRSIVNSIGLEDGLLTLAFHPSYASNGYFYVEYTIGDNSLVLARFTISGDPDVADPGSELIILTVPHPNVTNHDGGTLAFGPDGYLYWSTGDAGNGNNGQDLNVLLGKLLRIDVDHGAPYTVPSSNPFAGGGGRPEIWAYGLRNPWRYSFDSLTGDIYIGDVGQSEREEIDFQPASSTGGENYGWDVLEGNKCFNPPAGCVPPSGYVPPVTDYTHSFVCAAVVGGYVYRGSLFPQIQGYYFYSDECSGIINTLHKDPVKGWVVQRIIDSPYYPSTFGQDHNGELYLADYSTGVVYKMCYNGAPVGPLPHTVSPRRAPKTPCPPPS